MNEQREGKFVIFTLIGVVLLLTTFPVSVLASTCLIDEEWCSWSTGDGYSIQPCPNGDVPLSFCWLKFQIWERTLECSNSSSTESYYGRPNCDDTFVDFVALPPGCQYEVTTEWEKWDMSDPRNQLISCSPLSCFCDEDTPGDIVMAEMANDNCD